MKNDKAEMESFASAWVFFRIGMPAGDDIDALYSRIAQKDVQALNELKALAKDNNAQTLAELGFIYEYGVAVPKDTIQAIKYYEQACHVE